MNGISRPPNQKHLAKTSDSLQSLSKIERTEQRLWALAFLLFLLVTVSLLSVDAAFRTVERLVFDMRDAAQHVLDQYGTGVALFSIVVLACAYLYEKLLAVRDRNRQLVRELDANARVLELRSHQLDTWDQLSHQLITNFNLPPLLELIARTAADVTESDCAAVIVSEKDSPHLRLAAIHRRGLETELARRVAAKAMETGDPIELGRGALPDDFARPDLEWEDLAGIAATPLLTPDTVRGALLVGRLAPSGPFPTSVTEVLESFGNQASIALEKAHLYAENQRQLQRLSGLLEELRRAHDRQHSSAGAKERGDDALPDASGARSGAGTDITG